MKKTVRYLVKHTPVIGPYLRRRFTREDPYRLKISSEHHNKIILLHDGMPVPPIKFRDMVRRGAILAEDFILEGQQVYEAVSDAVIRAGGHLRPDTRVLEFGVGCGRVARHFLSNGYHNFVGTDVDSDLIEWCTKHLVESESISFVTNGYEPPLPIESESIDVAFSISVFTHMSEDNQIAWAKEIARVMRPGGLVFVSFLERSEAELPAKVKVVERRDAEYSRSWLGTRGAPEVYFNTYATKSYMSDLFGAHFKQKGYAAKVIRNHQSALVLQRM